MNLSAPLRTAMVCIVLACGPLHSEIIFDNLPPDGAFSGAEIGLGAIPSPGAFVELGIGFTPDADYRLASLEIPLDYRTGPNIARISVWSGASSPTDLLEQFVLTDVLPPGRAQIISIPSVDRPLLSAGEQYWVTITGGAPTTWLGWAYPAAGADSGLVAGRGTLSDPWFVAEGNRGTMRINADPVAIPEPGTFTLLSGSLIAAALRRRRARVAPPERD